MIVAHPDDEVIGLGAQLPRLRNGVFVEVTNGGPANGRDARESGFCSVAEYVSARQRELQCALSMAGLERVRKFELACPDQEAAYHLVSLSRSVRDILLEARPEIVVTHAYEGGHPDHDATAFAVHAACALLRQSAPPLIEASSYHNSGSGIETGCFLPAEGVQAITVQLTPQQREFKQRLLNCFTTQRKTLAQFRTDIECFRPAPRYDFSEPPHAGQLFYERFDWGPSALHFGELARAALDELELAGAL